MKLVEPREGVVSSDGLAALALITAVIDGLPVNEQRRVLSAAAALLLTSPGVNRDEARRIVSAMLAQLGPTEARP
jgi:hypothetical protein